MIVFQAPFALCVLYWLQRESEDSKGITILIITKIIYKWFPLICFLEIQVTLKKLQKSEPMKASTALPRSPKKFRSLHLNVNYMLDF